jgi:hypothetical protein
VTISPIYRDIIIENTIAAGAVLDFKRIPIELVCLDWVLHRVEIFLPRLPQRRLNVSKNFLDSSRRMT